MIEDGEIIEDGAGYVCLMYRIKVGSLTKRVEVNLSRHPVFAVLSPVS